MQSLIKIGAEISKDDAANFAETIKTIFEAGHKNHMDQCVIERALNAFQNTFEVKNVTITHSNFTGDKNVTINTEEQE
jgi:hypothetical protein